MSYSQSDDLFPNLDEYSDSKNLQKQNAELRHMNGQLIKELNSIKNQFKEATCVKDQMQKIHDTNAKLASDLRKIRSEKDEIDGRMKCNIEALEKKRSELEDEKKEIEKRAQKAIDESRELFAKEKNELKSQLNQTNIKYQNLQETMKLLNDEVDSLKSSLNNVLNAAQTFFVIPFKSVDQLSQYMSSSKNTNTQNKDNSDGQNLKSNLNDLQSKVNALKQKVHSERKSRKETEARLSKLQQQFTQNQTELECKNQELQNQLKGFQGKSDVSEGNKNFDKSNSEEKIIILTKALDKQKEKNKELQKQVDGQKSTNNNNQQNEISNLQSAIELKHSKIKTLQTTLVSLKQQNTLLLSRLKDDESTKDSLRAKNQSLLDENMQCTTEIQKLREEKNKLSVENSVLHEQNDSLQGKHQVASTNLSHVKSSLSDIQCQNEKYRNTIALTEMALTKQKQEIINIARERTICIDALQKQSAAMRALEDELANITESYKYSQKRVQELTKTVKQNELMPKMEEIPETSWFCIDFPRDLCSTIVEAASEKTPTTTKLRRILSVIAKYYNNEIEKVNKSLKVANKQNNEAALKVGHLLSTLSQIVKNAPSDYQVFISDPSSEKQLIQAITAFHDSQIEMKVNNIKMVNFLKEMASKLKTDNISGVEDAFIKFFDLHNQLNKQLNEERNLTKKLKRALRTAKANLENEKNQAEGNDKARSTIISNLQREKLQLQNDLTELSEKVVKMEIHVKGIESNHCVALNDKEEEKENEINGFMKQVEVQKTDYVKQIEQRDEYLTKASNKIEKLEREISQWKRTSELMKNAKLEKDQQYNTLISKMEEGSKEIQKSRETEVSEIKAQYERIIDDIKGKNKNLKNLIEQINESLNDATAQNKNLSSTNAQLSSEIQQLKSELQSLQEESKREKQLNDAKVKAVELSNETQRLLDLENAKEKCDEEKRNLFEFVALSFHHLFDAREELSNESFKVLIEKASKELQKYIRQEATIRRLLGLKPTETPEEAISKLLLSMYQHQ